MTQALQTISNSAMATWEVMRQQSEILIKSGFLPAAIKTPEQALAIMMMGDSLGIDRIVALNSINVIQGKPTVSPQLMMALIRRSGQLENFAVSDDGKTCTVIMKRRGETEHRETFSQDDAASMQLAGKDNWRKQPAVMRKWRCISAACRVVFPDVIWGLASYTAEEINPDLRVDEDGVVIETAAVNNSTPQDDRMISAIYQHNENQAHRETGSVDQHNAMLENEESAIGGHWSDDKAKRQAFILWLKEQGINTQGFEKVVGKLPSAFDSPQAAKRALLDAQKTPSKPAKPSKPQWWQDEGELAAFKAYIQRFNIQSVGDAEDIMLTKLDYFKSRSEAEHAAGNAAIHNGYYMVATQATYRLDANKKPIIVLETPIPTRYYSRKKLAEAATAGRETTAWLNVTGWELGPNNAPITYDLPEPLAVRVQRENDYLKVIEVAALIDKPLEI